MERLRFHIDLHRFVMPLVIVAGCAIAVWLGITMAQFGYGTREIAILVLVVTGLVLIFLPSERILQIGFYIWLLTFGFGWRTLYLTPSLNIHPIEVLAYTLVFLVLLNNLLRRTPLDLRFPKSVLLLVGLALMGMMTGIARGVQFEYLLQEFKNFLVVIPIFYLVQWFIRDRRHLERVSNLLILVGTYIALLGMLDFFLPGLSRSIANDPGVSPVFLAESYAGNTFARVGFIFFGNFTAGFVIFSFFGLTVHHFFRALGKENRQAALFGALIMIQLFGMYLSGFRGLWYAVVGFILAYGLVRTRAVILLVSGLVAIPFLPENFMRRFASLFVAGEADSSQLGRFELAQSALDSFYRSPIFGVGLTGSGYVHSDLIQIAANLGVFAVLTLGTWWGDLLLKAWRLQRRRDWHGDYAAALFATLVGNLIVLAGEGTLAFLQLIAPIWLMCVLAYKLNSLARETESADAR